MIVSFNLHLQDHQELQGSQVHHLIQGHPAEINQERSKQHMIRTIYYVLSIDTTRYVAAVAIII